MNTKTKINLLEQQDGEYLIAYLSEVELRKGGSFVDERTKKEFTYGSATKLTFLIKHMVQVEMAGSQISQEKQKEIQALIVHDDEVAVLKDYKQFQGQIGAKFLIAHKGISQSNGVSKMNISSSEDIFLVEQISQANTKAS